MTDEFATFLQHQIDQAIRVERTARDEYMQTPYGDEASSVAYETARERTATLEFIAREYKARVLLGA